MEIERLSSEEWQRLRAVRLRALDDAPDAFGTTLETALAWTPETWATQLRGMAVFVAVHDHVDVGLVRGVKDDRELDRVWLISMWVAPEVRGLGAGDALVRAVVSWTRASGAKRIGLDVADRNTHAIALYARNGFEPNGVVSTLPRPREHITEHQRELRLR
jgi:GNAT superfamily N-acetyltransferase